jgi:NADPH:quinone reductase-like Zn-dependent oxidoreductase
MRALVYSEFGGPEQLRLIDTEVPDPGPGEVLVRVAAAPLHPTDGMALAGLYVQFGAAAEAGQYAVGVDFAGRVERVGDDVTTVVPGQDVIGIQERIDPRTGAQADYVIVEEWAVAPAPTGVAPAEAAGLPLNGLTALQALTSLALPPNGTLLVTGAAGAVGTLAVQLAVVSGVRVVAQARALDEPAARRNGARWFISSDQPLGPTVRRLVPGGVDGVLDAANLGVRAMDAVAHGGTYASLLNAAPQSRREIRTTNVAYHTDRAGLGLLSALAAGGVLRVEVARIYPLSDYAQAHALQAKAGTRGLLVLVP